MNPRHAKKIIYYTYLFHKIGLLDSKQKQQIEDHYIQKRSIL
ncbi:hypothetical protein [Rossellomorea sp. NS-SX7]